MGIRIRLVPAALSVLFTTGICQVSAAAWPESWEATRAALGGPALDAVHSFVAEARCLRAMGPLTLASRVTLRVWPPDRYLRTDALRLLGKGAEMTIGFNSHGAIQKAASEDGRRFDPADLVPQAAQDPAIQGAAGELRRELRVLLLGWLGNAFDVPPMAIAYQGLAEAPDGKADALQFTFADGSTALLFTDSVTHLPLMVSWQASDTLAPLRSLKPGSAPAPFLDPANTPPALVEHRWYFSDYRRVGGVRWPFAARHAVGGELVEELKFERMAINPSIDPKLFEADR
jgi:hypothetical protein